jgi:hypothetical protein
VSRHGFLLTASDHLQTRASTSPATYNVHMHTTVSLIYTSFTIGEQAPYPLFMSVISYSLEVCSAAKSPRNRHIPSTHERRNAEVEQRAWDTVRAAQEPPRGVQRGRGPRGGAGRGRERGMLGQF